MARIRERQEKAAYDKPISADFRFGNLCNLRCQICNPHNSSQIERDAVLSKWRDAKYVRMKGRYQGEWYDAPELEEEIAEFSSDIEFINLGGGEPSISRPVQKWLTRLIESGQAARIELRVQTNLTNVNPRFLDLVAQFWQPRIYLSIDGFGPLNDYLRYPSKWRIIERNADYLTELAKRSKMSIHLTPAIGAYNALSIVHLFEWAVGRGFDIIANHVRGVDALDCALIPTSPRARRAADARLFTSVTAPSPVTDDREFVPLSEEPVDSAYADPPGVPRLHPRNRPRPRDAFRRLSPEIAPRLLFRPSAAGSVAER